MAKVTTFDPAICPCGAGPFDAAKHGVYRGNDPRPFCSWRCAENKELR